MQPAPLYRIGRENGLLENSPIFRLLAENPTWDAPRIPGELLMLAFDKLQYAMEARLRLHQPGWHEIEVMDDDLGRSAAGLVTRAASDIARVCQVR